MLDIDDEETQREMVQFKKFIADYLGQMETCELEEMNATFLFLTELVDWVGRCCGAPNDGELTGRTSSIWQY